jgi:hypothetical protein
MRRITFAVFIILFLGFSWKTSRSQDVLTLYNGRKIYTKIVEVNSEFIVYKHSTDIKERNKSIVLARVFSIESQGKEEVLYKPDQLDPDLFTMDEMRMFIKGEQEAMRFYDSDALKIVSIAAGVASGYFGFFYGLIGPPLVTTIVGSFSPRMSKQTITDPELLNNPDFVEGYCKKVRDYKIRKSIVWGGIGYAIGLAGFIIIANNN